MASDKEYIRDNPNPKANIAIVCPYPFYLYAFLSVYEHLPNAEFITDFDVVPRGGTYELKEKNRLRKYLQESGVFWRDFEQSGETVEEFSNKYGVFACPFHSGIVAKPENLKKKKVRIFYSGSKDTWTFGLWNAYFDLILCFGEFHREKLLAYTKNVYAVGNPKFDRFGKNTKAESATNLGIAPDPKKRTLLYVPTWGKLSSIRYMQKALHTLASTYNVILKPHHMTTLYDKHLVELYDPKVVSLIDDTKDIIDALNMTDIVISDNSGALFEAALAEKELILIDLFGMTRPDYSLGMPSYFMQGGQTLGVSTSRESIEQSIKQPGKEIAPLVCVSREESGQQIAAEKVTEALLHAKEQIYINRQKALLERFYARSNGKAGVRSAELIQELLYGGEKEISTLAWAADEMIHRIESEAYGANEATKRELLKYENAKKMTFIQKINFLTDEFL